MLYGVGSLLLLKASHVGTLLKFTCLGVLNAHARAQGSFPPVSEPLVN